MICNIFDKNIIRILTYFLISPGSRYTRSEIKDKTRMNNIPLDNTLLKLNRLGLITHHKKIYSLNFNNSKNQKIFDLISEEYRYLSIPHQIFNTLVELSDKLAKTKPITSAILFGSYAKLIHTKDSDIDIAVILTDRKKKTIEVIKKDVSKISKKIELHFFEEGDMKAKDPLIKDILRNGNPIF